MEQYLSIKALIGSIVYSGVGILVLAVAFVVFDKLTPGNLWKEIVEEHNMALAITVGAMTLAIAQIIGAAIHG